MKIAVAVLGVLVLAGSSTSPQSRQNGQTTAATPQNTQITPTGNYNGNYMGNDTSEVIGVPQNSPAFLALGDSYTIGEKVDSASRWPVQLARSLRAAGVQVGDPQIIAKTGWTTDELAAGIEKVGVKGTHALVSLLIGVNNQYRGRNADEYREQFRRLLDQAIGYAGGKAVRVIVVSIPDWGVMPFAQGRDRAKIGREIDQFNAIGKDESERAGAKWVDITPTSRAMQDGWATSDGLHPSGAQYEAWAALALEPAKKALVAK